MSRAAHRRSHDLVQSVAACTKCETAGPVFSLQLIGIDHLRELGWITIQSHEKSMPCESSMTPMRCVSLSDIREKGILTWSHSLGMHEQRRLLPPLVSLR